MGAVVGLGEGFTGLLKRFEAVKGAVGFVLVVFYVFPKRLGTPGKRGFGPSAVGFPKREAPVFGVESAGAGVLKRKLGALPVAA